MGRLLAGSLILSVSLSAFLADAQTARAETVVIDDPLDGKTVGEVVGGMLAPGGYRPGVGANHILYRLPAPVKEGVITVEIKGFDGRADDNGFVAMYDGRGIPEPTIFESGVNEGFRPFRENYFRFNAHWRDGALFKSVLILASPERAQNVDPMTKAASYWRPVSGPPSPRDFTTEPNGTGYSWNPAAWATLKIEWKKVANRVQFSVFMDARRVWGPVSAPAGWEYQPREHRIWLGSGPGPMKYESKSATTVFRNFKLVALTDAVPPLAPSPAGGISVDGGASRDTGTAPAPDAGTMVEQDTAPAPVKTPPVPTNMPSPPNSMPLPPKAMTAADDPVRRPPAGCHLGAGVSAGALTPVVMVVTAAAMRMRRRRRS